MTEEKLFRKGRFCIDDSESVPGYTRGDWPYFTKEQVEQVIVHYSSGDSGPNPARYDAKTDAFVFIMDGSGTTHLNTPVTQLELDDYDMELESIRQVFPGFDIQYYGEPVHVYAVGARSWRWSDEADQSPDVSEKRDDVTDEINILRERYVDSGRVLNFMDITHLLSFDFANDIIRTLKAFLTEGNLVNSHDFMCGAQGEEGKAEIWDNRILESDWGIFPPNDLTWNDLNNAPMQRHFWVEYEQKHYDAECPEGVDNFFSLPIFQRQIDAYLKMKRR